MTAILWCCHVRGPDDVLAAPDYATALQWSDMIMAINFAGDQKPQALDDMLLKPAPALWPYSAEAHANALPKCIAEMAKPAWAPGTSS